MKGSSHTSWKHCSGVKDGSPGWRSAVQHNNNAPLLSSLPTLHLALCGEGFQCDFFFEELETLGGDGWWGGCVCIHQPTPGLWSMKEARQKTAAARHSDKTLQIVPLIKNLSCRNTIDSKRGRENRQPGPCTPSPPAPTPSDMPSLSFSLSVVPKLHPKKLCIPHINPRMGAVCEGTAVCKPHCKWVSLSPPPSPLCH